MYVYICTRGDLCKFYLSMVPNHARLYVKGKICGCIFSWRSPFENETLLISSFFHMFSYTGY